jgi:regulator of replication initiation timing
MEQRAEIANTAEETDMESELLASVEEITNMEKQLKTLLQVTEFLFENQEELQGKLDHETAELETAKRDATTFRLKFD